ncbi:MAG: efflux RND transporter periplasmic adaptor subunit [Proteobacteria bacterium]|nr:efflux RND transporter periplasmic adaptor subunit [Pseudomonadota bacterium]
MNKPVTPDLASAGPASPVALGHAPAPRPRRRLWIAAALALVVMLAIAFAVWRSAGTASGVTYVTAAATRGDVTRAVTATGTVNPVLTIIVGSYVSGVIKEIRCDYNTEVKIGQVCAEIDPAPYQTVVDQNRANLAVARAQLEKDKANLAYAQLNYDRNARLAQSNAVSKDVLDNARNALDQATAQIGVDQATIRQREAQLAAAEVNLGYTHIVSPVNGTVVSRNVTMGQTVAASFQTPTLFLIATDLTKMQVDTNVSESDIGGIKEGNRSTFTVDAFPRRTFRGAVSQVRQSPQTVQNVVTYDVVLSVDNKDLALKPGMTAATRVIVDQRRDVLRVPSQALRYAPPSAGAPAGGARRTRNAEAPAQVYVLRDNAPVAVPVTAGLDDDSFTEIVAGDLRPGDKVIVSEQRGAKAAATPRPRL